MLSVDQTLVSVYFSFADKVFSLLMGKITYFSLQSRKLLFISKKEEDLERESHNQVGLSAAYGFEQEKGGYFWTCEAGRTSFIKIKYKTCFENFTIFHLGSNKSCWRQTQRIYIFRARCGNCKTSNRAVDSGLFQRLTQVSFPFTACFRKKAFLSLHFSSLFKQTLFIYSSSYRSGEERAELLTRTGW